MKALLILAFFASLSSPASSQFRGRTYVDINQSGSYDKGDIPLSGVAVTDGKNVVRTDKKGRFSLPGYEKTRFITVTTPAGYETSRFYLPVEKDIKEYNFAFTESKRTKAIEHTFVQITDTEVTGGLGRWVTDLKEFIKNEAPAFLIHTGDICYEPGLTMHTRIVNSETMGCPTYYCIGNHDLVKGKYGEELYESIYGPTWYSFDVGNTHYVVTPMANGDHAPGYSREEVGNWLKNDLDAMREGQTVILFNHDLFTPSDKFIFGADEHQGIDLRNYRTKAQIYGHMHYNYVRNQGGIYTICTSTPDKGGIDHSPASFRTFQINKDGNVFTELRYTFVMPRVVIASPLDGQLASPVRASGKIPVSVNTYCSQAVTRQVTYVLTDAESGKEISRGNASQMTDWNWADEIAIPASMNEKKLTLKVESTFGNGQTVTTSNTFEYKHDFKPSVKPTEEWRTLLRDAAHTGGINTSKLTPPLQQIWVSNAGTNIFMTSPLIADSKVFTATTDDNTLLNKGVCAFDLQTGKALWKYHTDNSVKNTIAYEEGIVVAQDAECNLYAIDASTGKLLWKHYLDLQNYPYLTEGITIDKGVVYAGIGAGLSAYELKTGNCLWVNRDWKQREGATTTLTVAGDVLVSGSQWGGLYGNDIHTGKMIWSLSEDGLRNRGASPVYRDGKLYLISASSFFVIDPQTGKVLVKKDSSANLDATSTPLITNDKIIFGTVDKGLISLDKETLFSSWKMESLPSLVYTAPYSGTPQATIETSPVLSAGTVYVGASDGYLYALDETTGIIQWKANLGAPIFSSVAVSGNILVVSDFSGNVYAFQASQN